MKTKRPNVYVHKTTGDIQIASKSQAKKLPPEYEKVQFVENEQGKRVMRLHLDGATVDISENDAPEVPENGDTTAN